MNKFCPKCGKSVKRGIFCKECNPVVINFKPINIKLCPSGKYFFRGKWTPYLDLFELTEKLLSKNLKEKFILIEGLEKYPDILGKTGLKKDFDVLVSVNEAEFVVPITVEITSSPALAKVGSTYFEGILQVRNLNNESKKIVKQILKEFEEAYVNKVVEKKSSVDFYFVKKKFLTRVAEKIVNELGGFMDSNAQLFSRDNLTSKDMFRLNVVVHLPPFKKNDVVKKDGCLLLITGLGKYINSFDLEKGKKNSFKYDPSDKHEFVFVEIQKSKIINDVLLNVLNSSYELVNLKNPLNLAVKKNDLVSFVEHNGNYFLINNN